jgi:hypothetical protein
MRKIRQFLWIVATSITLAACAPETFTEIATPRSQLITGFESYASRDEVVPSMSSKFKVEVIEDSARPPEDRRPPFSILTLSFSGFQHLNNDGELRITFFNNRLEKTWFYPDNPDAYFSALRLQGLVFNDREEITINNTVIWSAIDYRGKRYVAWADKRLRAQSRRWILSYS